MTWIISHTFVTFATFTGLNFSYTKFHARKTVLGKRSCTWEIVPIKEQMWKLTIIARYGSKKLY